MNLENLEGKRTSHSTLSVAMCPTLKNATGPLEMKHLKRPDMFGHMQ